MSARPFQLSRSMKVEIYRAVERVGLDPRDFDWILHQEGDGADELIHRPTGSYIQVESFNGGGDHFWAAWHPPSPSGERYGSLRDEQTVREFFANWLKRVKVEHDLPDLWAAVAAERELLKSDPPDGDQPFTTVEREQIADRLNQLEKEIARVSTVNSQGIDRLHASFERVSAASAKLTRREWKTMFVGTLFEKILELALDPQRVLHLANVYVGPIVARMQNLLG